MSPSEVEVEVEVDVDVDVVDVSTCGGFSLGVKGWSLKPVDNLDFPAYAPQILKASFASIWWFLLVTFTLRFCIHAYFLIHFFSRGDNQIYLQRIEPAGTCHDDFQDRSRLAPFPGILHTDSMFHFRGVLSRPCKMVIENLLSLLVLALLAGVWRSVCSFLREWHSMKSCLVHVGILTINLYKPDING